MELLIWPCVALFLFAVLLRSGKRRDGIDWKSRGLLLLLSTTICLLLDRWIRISALNAAEAAATSGTAANGLVFDIAARYQPVLLPLYIAIVAVLIDVLARLIPRSLAVRATDREAASRHLLANLLLFVVVPAWPYAWAANFASSGSVLADAARDVLMPIIATYGAPAHWLQVATIDGGAWQRLGEASWPWNPGYHRDSYLSLYGFLTDCLPWATMAVLMSLITLARRHVLVYQSFSEYFVTPKSSAGAGLLARIATGSWRGRAALIFTLLWTAPLAIWSSFIALKLALSYVLAWMFVLAPLTGLVVGLTAVLVAGLAALIILVMRLLNRNRG